MRSSKNHYESFTKTQFKEAYGMTRGYFAKILEKFNKINPKPKMLGEKLLINIIFLSNISTYRKMTEIFGLPHAKIFRIIGEITSFPFLQVHNYINLPNIEECEELSREFPNIGLLKTRFWRLMEHMFRV